MILRGLRLVERKWFSIAAMMEAKVEFLISSSQKKEEKLSTMIRKTLLQLGMVKGSMPRISPGVLPRVVCKGWSGWVGADCKHSRHDLVMSSTSLVRCGQK